MEAFLSLIYCLLISLAFVALFKKLRISAMVGMILAGIITGSHLSRQIFLEPNVDLILDIGDIGLLSIMFLAGMEVSWSMLYKEKKDAALVAVFAAVTPFLLGLFTFVALGFSIATSLFIGLCMSITAEATKARILLEMKKLKTKLGSLMMGAGIIDDIFGMGLFMVFGYFFHANLPVKEVIMLSGAILAFFGGIFIHMKIGRTEKKMPVLEKTLLYVVAPFFFVSMGINFSGGSLILEPVLLLIIIIVAFSGKMVGTLLTKPFTKLKVKQLYLIGLGMNSRGAVELALAFMAFRAGFLPVSIYSDLIVMALITTLIFPLFFTRLIRKNPRIMD